MEKKKLIWVVLSVTLFFVVVLGGALYILRPVQTTSAGKQSSEEKVLADSGFDAYEYIKKNETPPGLEPEKSSTGAEEMTIVVGEPEKTTETKKSVPETINVTEKTVNVVSSGKTAKTVKKSRVESKPKRTIKKPKVVKEYWIQAASYSSLAKAESLRDNLLANGVGSRILSKEIAGKTYYRVRIGPYGSREDAERFLGELKKLKGLEKSYISIVYVRK